MFNLNTTVVCYNYQFRNWTFLHKETFEIKKPDTFSIFFDWTHPLRDISG